MVVDKLGSGLHNLAVLRLLPILLAFALSGHAADHAAKLATLIDPVKPGKPGANTRIQKAVAILAEAESD